MKQLSVQAPDYDTGNKREMSVLKLSRPSEFFLKPDWSETGHYCPLTSCVLLLLLLLLLLL
jgi:hypothetical protein